MNEASLLVTAFLLPGGSLGHVVAASETAAELAAAKCAICQGTNAEDCAQIPRLAGEHAPYPVKQTLYVQSARRGGGEVHVMHAAIGEGMTMQEMEAVAANAASK